MAQPGTAASLLLALLFLAGCGRGERNSPGPSSGGSSTGDNSAGAPSSGAGGTGGDGGIGGDSTAAGPTSGVGGVGGSAGESAGGSGGAATGGSAGETSTGQSTTGSVGSGGTSEPETCEYPESLGGAGDPTRCGVTPGAWYPLGDSDFTTWPERAVWRSASGDGIATGVSSPQLVSDSDGRLVIAGRNANYANFEMLRWDGSNWETLPTAALNEPLKGGGASDVEMVLDQTGNPIVAVEVDDSLQVFRWENRDWVLLGEWPVSTFRVAVDADNDPIVVYADVHSSTGRPLKVKRWNGASFENLPDAGHAEQFVAFTPTLAVRENGDIVVAWVEWQPGLEGASIDTLHVQQFDGERWEPLGDSAVFGNANAVGIAVDDADRVLLAGYDLDVDEPFIRVWDGTTWSPAQPGLSDQRLVEGPDGTVYLSGELDYYAEGSAAIWRWDGGEWVSVAAPDASSLIALAVGPDERLAAVWIDEVHPDPNDRYYQPVPDALYCMVNTDGEWRELGEGTARGDGLSAGLPQELVSLEDGLFLHSNCRVDRWDGESWQALDLSEWTDSRHCERSTLTESPTGQPVLGVWISEVTDPVDACYEYAYYNEPCPYSYNNLHLLGWTGASWEALTEPLRRLFDPVSDAGLSVAFDSTGAPFVAWEDYDFWDYYSFINVEVIVWDGTEWESSFDGRWNEYDAGPLVALRTLPDDRMLMLQGSGASSLYSGGRWVELPEMEAGFGSSEAIQVGLDAMGTLFVADVTYDGELVLFELLESSWRRVTPDEARLSTLPEHMRLHVRDDDGEIYLRRFENGTWGGLSSSHLGGGVSKSVAWSDNASFAMYDGTTCVSWVEQGELDGTQLVRCHD